MIRSLVGRLTDKSADGPSLDERRLGRRQTEQLDLRELRARVKPRPVGAEDELARACAHDRFDEVIESTGAGRVRVDVRMPDELIDERHVSTPVVAETGEVRDDEIDIAIGGREEFDTRRVTHDVVEHWQAK